MCTLFTKIIILYLDCSISMVLFWLLLFCFLRGPLPYLIFSENIGNFLSFGFHNLESLSTLQKSNILSQNFVTELLQVFHLFQLLFFLYKPLFLSLFLCLSLSNFSYFLYYSLDIASFSYLFQVSLELLLLFMLFLYFLTLLFKHFGVSLGNVRE